MELPMIPTGDFHGWTAAHNTEFHAHMRALFGNDWADKMEGKVIRGFAKRWNFLKLYGAGGKPPISPEPSAPAPTPAPDTATPSGTTQEPVEPPSAMVGRSFNVMGLCGRVDVYGHYATLSIPTLTLRQLAVIYRNWYESCEDLEGSPEEVQAEAISSWVKNAFR